jgi:putative ABC transport system permease protein
MKIILSFWATLVIAVKRIISQKGLALASLVGLVVSIALTTSIPVYADAVYFRLFNENVSTNANNLNSPGQPASFALLYTFQSDPFKIKRWSDIQPVDKYLSEQAGLTMKLPERLKVRYFNTDTLSLFPANETNFGNTDTLLGWFSFSTMSDIEKHITITEGRLPKLAIDAGQPVEVLISEEMAARLGLHAGEEYVAFNRVTPPSGGTPVAVQIPVRVAGIWRVTNPNEPYWFIQPTFLDERFLVSEDIFSQQVGGYLPGLVYSSIWYLLFDGSNVHYSEAVDLSGRITSTNQQAVQLLPEIRLVQSPLTALENYRANSTLLTVQLYAISFPILGLLLAFTSLTAGLSVEERRNEIAVLRSRGALTLQVVGIAAMEGLILGGVGLLLSLPVSLLIARWIGYTRSFLDFNSATILPVRLTATSLEFGLVAVGLALISMILPTISAARHTITTYKQERSRMLRKPWWQRAWLDVILFAVTVYGAYLLRRQGSVALLGSRDPFENPLLFLIPALCVFSLSLFFLRVMPLLVSGVAWLSARTHSVGMLMATRQLSRTPGFYVTPLVLLLLTLSLSAYTASLADTVDRSLDDKTYYAVGGSVKFLDSGQSLPTFSNFGGGAQIPTPTTDTQEPTGPEYFFLPVQDYLKIPGVQEVARVGRYKMSGTLGGTETEGVILGVDRFEFSQAAFWRPDFSRQSLGDLMNYLAMFPDGVLIPEAYLGQKGLQAGDTLPLSVIVYQQKVDLNFKIVGGFKYFPTWYPKDGPLVVANLDYLFENVGGTFPYEVWMKTAPGLSINQLKVQSSPNVGGVDLSKSFVDAAGPIIETEQLKPQRQGLFGVLSVGFFSAALLTVLGFLLYALFSFRRRFIELGVLRAIGLSYFQMVSYLAWELAFLILMGMGVGTVLGIGVASWFIPFLQLGYDEASRIPPFIVQISWPAIFRIYSLFGALFVLALIVLVVLLQRMKIFQAIKLGETV